MTTAMCLQVLCPQLPYNRLSARTGSCWCSYLRKHWNMKNEVDACDWRSIIIDSITSYRTTSYQSLLNPSCGLDFLGPTIDEHGPHPEKAGPIIPVSRHFVVLWFLLRCVWGERGRTWGHQTVKIKLLCFELSPPSSRGQRPRWANPSQSKQLSSG